MGLSCIQDGIIIKSNSIYFETYIGKTSIGQEGLNLSQKIIMVFLLQFISCWLISSLDLRISFVVPNWKFATIHHI
jgi:hypothetical protein